MAERAIRVPGLESHDAVLDIVLACNHNPQRITWLQEIVFAGGNVQRWNIFAANQAFVEAAGSIEKSIEQMWHKTNLWIDLKWPNEPERTGETDV